MKFKAGDVVKEEPWHKEPSLKPINKVKKYKVLFTIINHPYRTGLQISKNYYSSIRDFTDNANKDEDLFFTIQYLQLLESTMIEVEE